VSNVEIRWLDETTFDNVDISDTIAGNLGGIDTYNTLGGDAAFVNEPAKYINSSRQSPNKEVGAAVICKGTLSVKDGDTAVGGGSPPSTSPVAFQIDSVGNHQISTSLDGVVCYAAAVKHPLNDQDFPEFFQLNNYPYNGPSIDPSIAQRVITLNVQQSGGQCIMHQTRVSASGALNVNNDIMVNVTMHNDGDAMMVTGVSSTNSGYSVSKFDVTQCGVLGLGSLCPPSNGFDESIPHGGDKQLYVLVEPLAGASGGTTLVFSAQTASQSCGGAGTCQRSVDLNGAMTCSIEPPSLTYGTLEVAEFHVTCRDLAGNPIACQGSNWYWADGLAGDFIERDNTHALAYPTSAAGSSGTLRYRSGLASCLSDITVTTPSYECEFIPSSATMNISTSKDFQLNCYHNGNKETPDDASYDLINGLQGGTSNSDVNGTTYDAPGSPTEGKLRGFGEFNDAPPPIKGAIALAPINVVNSSSPPGCTGPGCGSEGASDACAIDGDGPLTVYPGFYGWVGIKCGKFHNETCPAYNTTWAMDPSSVGSIAASDNLGAFFRITAPVGTSGRITAAVTAGTCYKPFIIGQPQCWQIS
jgi:hypothetical protein